MPATSAAAPAASVRDEVLDGRGLSFSQAARLLPSARAGRPVNAATLWRWALTGIRLADGSLLRLEAVKLSGRWLTTAAALGRFIDAQTPDLGGKTASAPRPPAGRRKAAAAADAELRRRGC